MDGSYGQHGWKEFHRNRKDILAEYDKILEQTQNRPIQVAHGIGVEAYLRKWLTEFLPKKFGVTSGYVIPNLYDDSGKIYHYDIIIYDRNESPILWTEGNQDDSEQGKFRAIPAKYVMGLYEVKSRLTKKNTKEALEKLDQTKDFVDQLNPNYSCGIIFIELKESDVDKTAIIKELIKAKNVFKFSEGIVLRYEGDSSSTGIIKIFPRNDETDIDNDKLTPLAKSIEALNIYSTEDGSVTISERGGGIKLVQTKENHYSISKSYGVIYDEEHFSVHLSWSRSYFSEFCIDLLSALEGLVYNDKNRPSFGQIFDTLERKQADLQGSEQENGKPFLKLKLYEGDEIEKMPQFNQDEEDYIITFNTVVENWGESDVIISDDFFKNKFTLPKKTFGGKTHIFKLKLKDKTVKLTDFLNSDDFQIPYRLVYYEDKDQKEFYSIEQVIFYKDGKLELK